MIARLDATAKGFDAAFDALLARDAVFDDTIQNTVRTIIARVRHEGDSALAAYSAEFDNYPIAPAAFRIMPDACADAYHSLAHDIQTALNLAHERISAYHTKQLEAANHIDHSDALGVNLTQRTHAIDRAGLYVPGGKASYPSSVLMNAVPARIAGVGHITMVTPGKPSPAVLAAAHLARVDEVISLGGAHAIAALAYGTETIRPVDKIVGPGNAYVAEAKRQVFGKVGIDSIAGPSEVLIISDGTTNPEWVAYDLFAQAEHDADAQAILISTNSAHLDAVADAIRRLLPTMPRRDIIEASLKQRGALIAVPDDGAALLLANRMAPEHLELLVADSAPFLAGIQHAGAIFVGAYTPEAFGDYVAGANHVLPTAGSARFQSALSVHDFQKRNHIVHCPEAAARTLLPAVCVLAESEGLCAHAASARVRLNTPS